MMRMSETRVRAIVVHVELKRQGGNSQAQRPSLRGTAAKLEEARSLALAVGLEVAEAFTVILAERNPRTLLGSGKVHAITELVARTDAELVVIDGQLSPVQQRN